MLPLFFTLAIGYELTIKNVDCNIQGTQISCQGSPIATPSPQPPPLPSPTPTPKPPSNVFVFSPSKSSNRTFLPGCINGEDWQKTNCEYQGSLKKGSIYSAEIKVGSNFSKSFKVDRAEAGENYGWVDTVISYKPGDLTPISDKCKWTAIANYPSFVDQKYINANSGSGFNLFGGACVVNSDTTIYINMFENGPDSDKCGSTFICRVQFIEY